MITNKLVLSLLVIATFFLNLIVEWRNYRLDFLRGAFPADADSIGLPMGLYLIVWIAAIPFVLVALWSISKTNTDRLSILSYNSRRLALSFAVSLLFIFALSWNLFHIFEPSSRNDLLGVVYAIAETYTLACLRVVIIFFGRQEVQSET